MNKQEINWKIQAIAWINVDWSIGQFERILNLKGEAVGGTENSEEDESLQDFFRCCLLNPFC